MSAAIIVWCSPPRSVIRRMPVNKTQYVKNTMSY